MFADDEVLRLAFSGQLGLASSGDLHVSRHESVPAQVKGPKYLNANPIAPGYTTVDGLRCYAGACANYNIAPFVVEDVVTRLIFFGI